MAKALEERERAAAKERSEIGGVAGGKARHGRKVEKVPPPSKGKARDQAAGKSSMSNEYVVMGATPVAIQKRAQSAHVGPAR